MIRSAPGNAFSLYSVGQTGPVTFGWNSHIDNPGAEAATVHTTPSAAVGVLNFRDAIFWGGVEQSSDTYTWTHARLLKTETIIDAMIARGGKPIINVGTTNNTGLHSTMRPWDVTPPIYFQRALSFMVTHLGAKCLDWEIYNEPEGNPTAADTLHPAHLSGTEYAQMLQNCYTTIKTANPAATVWAGAGLDVLTNSSVWNQMQSTNWASNSDGYSTHPYYGDYPFSSSVHAVPEYTMRKARDVYNMLQAARPGCRFAITEHGNESNSISEDLYGRYLARQVFMFRCLKSEFNIMYSIYEYDAHLSGILNGILAYKANEPYYRRAIAVAHGAVDARYYQHVPLHAVAMLMNDGKRTLALWGHTDDGLSLSAADYTGTVTITVNNSGGAGTLTTTLMGDGSTVTQTCPTGYSQVRVPISGSAKVISFDIAGVQFVNLPV